MPGFTAPLREPAFRRFWFGGAISVFGDHLTFVAMPWLVLKLTNDPLAMGTVIAVAAVPRAVFMLFGGAFSDRWSPRLVMLMSNIVRFSVVVFLAGSTYYGFVTFPAVLVSGFIFGLADAFLFPAASAMPPRLLEPEKLAAGNGVLQGTFQLNLVLGPMVGGLLIALLGESGDQTGELTDRVALATVLAIDALTFLASIWALATLRERFKPEVADQSSLINSLIDGLRWAWRDTSVRIFVLLMAVLSLIFRGPFNVGVPTLANMHLPEGAAAFGTIMSALGVGSIIGAILAATRGLPPNHWMGRLLLIDFALFGAIMLLMAWVHELAIIATAVLLAGILDGYIIVFVTTWLQKHVPPERMGRVMAVVMFSTQGLFPVSSAAAGALARWDLAAMLLIGGIAALLVALSGLMITKVRRLGF